MRIKIDGELFVVLEIEDGYYLPSLRLDSRQEFVVAEDSESAGKAAREYWAEMAAEDPEEFRVCVGTEALVAWALGQSYAPGSESCSSLDDWLDLWLEIPEEHWASYDGNERTVTRCGVLARELGFMPTVAYRVA